MQPLRPIAFPFVVHRRPILALRVQLLLLGICLVAWTGCQTDRGTRVAEALDRGEVFLHRLQLPSGEIADTLNPLFDTWETIEAANALLAIAGDQGEAHLAAAARYLAQQADSAYVLCHNAACKGATCLETSAEYHLFRYIDGVDETLPANVLTDAIATLLPLHQPDGAWQIGNPDVRHAIAFPSVSGFALSILNLNPTGADSTTAIDSLRQSTIAWLLKQQTAQGDWGSAWEYYGCPGYALWAILRGLQPHAAEPQVASAITKAVSYIQSTQSTDGSWYHSLPPNPQQHGTASIKQTSPSLQTALMLAALLASHPSKNDPSLVRGIDFLLDSQTDSGAWDGGFFPIPHARYEKREYVFATAMALRVLAAYRDLQLIERP